MKVFISCSVGLLCIVLLYAMFVNRKTGHTIILNGKVTDTSRVDAESLENEIRTGLPIGDSVDTVNDFLAKRTIEHSFVSSSNTVYAIVNDVKGGSMLVQRSLSFRFHFDDSLKLKSIDAKVVYTGP